MSNPAPAFVTPCLLASKGDVRTEQAVRYTRVLRLARTKQAQGQTEVTIKLSDLAALIAIAANSDRAVTA